MSIKRALVCHPQMPQYDRQRGSQRALELIEFLQEAGWAVSFVAQHGNNGERYMRMLQQRGVATYIGFDSRTDQLIGSDRLDLAILGFWHIAELCMPIIRRTSPTTRVIVDSIDLHLLRNARRIFRASAQYRPSSLLDATYASDMIREVNIYAAADGVLAVSQKEADLINDLVGDPTLAHAVPLSEGLTRSTVPFGERTGILFVGNFLHSPNIEAAEYLCKDILPRLDQEILAHHPVYIVGNALNETVRSYGSDLPQIRMVGWVPSLQPYFERARISVVPLLHGAGTKGKLIQAMMSGIPSVSTRIGIEGLNLRHREHLLVADDPDSFASSIVRLLDDAELWQRLSHEGNAHITAVHGREAVRTGLMQAVSSVLAREAKPVILEESNFKLSQRRLNQPNQQYQQLIERIQRVVLSTLPPEATVIVVSKGDNELLKLKGRKAWHFPQTADGVYTGHYPADSAAAIAHLEALRAKGGDFLLFPSTALWWLEHYSKFKQHLEAHYLVVLDQRDTCMIFSLREATANDRHPILQSSSTIAKEHLNE
jgi:glycosyltransferase involved in cell wall biosynthesis